jgi:hypothetical protein|tara:strand:+ start:1476 stop:1739 length:264 start_codon:yes stop_codon:yes gene_type:complete
VVSFAGSVCSDDDNRHFWVSYVEEEIEYAKNKCGECSFFDKCLVFMATTEYPGGVMAGVSEFDRLEMKWRKVDSEEQSNWTEPDQGI